MKIRFALTIIFLLLAYSISAQQKPNVPEVDRIRIAEAFKVGQSLDNQIWKDWNKAPFAVMPVTPENEFLIRHSKPSQDFTLIGYDSLLQSEVYFRKRSFSPNLLATFPAVGGVSTIKRKTQRKRILLIG
ncbi:MAG TPA: hypothetical protein VK308_07975 [Pyrinomonadaceae bacterium]|nr:hypothetical protein [Pyrinomonadaceae bacterium]